MKKIVSKDEEYIYDGKVMISQTDLAGTIVYANREFCEVSGYGIDAIVGQNHSILRHKDMSNELFSKMWQTLNDTHPWHGIVKNLRQDGLYFWTQVEILPILNETKKITGYISVMKPASQNDITQTQRG